MAATSTEVRRLEQQQLDTGQGPCLDCHRTATPVLAPDLTAADARWPRFAPAVRQAGFAAAYALPMRHHDRAIGALNLFARTPPRWTPTRCASPRR
ncbi:GAF domain-containing protein [Pseudonocardia ammonioxydans]|uniref:GAF domain-containing protein n=1 Tax=Pseudonocardia ammonioxydans TaxID=260086 RepID=A0A1I5AU88_PSUAM|nr:GAF domain-containing protein [Pseudonocardia ammonioxydans]SFN65970.1 GAF domain-containing protein [Pseudonocardia ammonioxydans]